jgi:hypothetical protein|tara:strand:- start:514 stop:870 length:357 start_codon:yes stop_codon:yes gene_type:complete
MSHYYSDALRSLVPNAKLSIMNEDYDTLNWDESNTDKKPTKAELDAEIIRLDAEYLTTRYQRQRTNDVSERASGIQTSYPKIEEQLDKLWHDIDQGKLDKNGEFYKYIKNVKDTFPKP